MGLMKKKIALIFPYAKPEAGAPIARAVFFTKVLEEKGFETFIIAPAKKGIDEVENIKRYKGLIGLFTILLKEKPVLAIASGPPAPLILYTALFAKILGFPIIADVRDPWVKAKLAIGLLKENSFKYKLQRRIEYIAYKLSCRIFAVSEAIEKEIEELGIKKEKIRVIEHAVDIKNFRRVQSEGEKVRKEFGIGKRPVLIFVGSPWVGVETMIENIAKLLKEKNAFLLLILSKSASDSEQIFSKIHNAIKKGGLEKDSKIIFNVPHKELFKYLSAADIGLNIIPSGLNYLISNKIKEYIACGVPVSCKCDAACYSKNFIESKGIGVVSTSWEAFSERTKCLIGSNELKKLRKQALKISKEFSYERIGNKVLEEIESILENKSSCY